MLRMRPAGPEEQTPCHSLHSAGPGPPDPSKVRGSSSQLDSQPARLIGAGPPAGSASTSGPPLAIWWPRPPPDGPDQLEGPGSTQALVQMPTLPSLPAWSLPSLQLSFLTVKLKIMISPLLGYCESLACSWCSINASWAHLTSLCQHLQAQHSENEDHGIRSHHFTGNRWGNSGNSVRLYFSGLQNHYRW